MTSSWEWSRWHISVLLNFPRYSNLSSLSRYNRQIHIQICSFYLTDNLVLAKIWLRVRPCCTSYFCRTSLEIAIFQHYLVTTFEYSHQFILFPSWMGLDCTPNLWVHHRKQKQEDVLQRRRSWWRHQMQIFSALLAICAGNSPVTGEFPAQKPVTRSFDVFFDESTVK